MRPRRLPPAVAVMVAVTAAVSVVGAAPLVRARPSAAPPAGRVVVGAAQHLHARVAAAVGASSVRALRFRTDVAVLDVPSGQEEQAAAAAGRVPGVRWATPDAAVRAFGAPDDPGFPLQWHLADRRRYAHSANWEPVHGSGPTGRGVTVAVVDTGVTASPELPDVVAGFDFVDGDLDPADQNGHGTHVAGTVAQRTGNGIGVAGVAPQATVLAVRVLDATGAGALSDIIDAIALSVLRGAPIVNLSLGGSVATGLCEAVALAVLRGTTVVAAAGNEAGAVAFPAACPDAIAVSASTQTGAIASYSNRGPEVDIAAPGGDLSTDADGDGYADGVLQLTVRDGALRYVFDAGTSMAAPHVSGAAALLRATRPDLTPADVRALLLGAASDRGAPGADAQFGAGLLDIAASLGRLGVGPSATAEPPAAAPPPTETAPSTGTRVEVSPGVTRLAGTTRYGTATKVTSAGWEGTVPEAFLATGEAFADALAATPAAAAARSPLLLTASCVLPDPTAVELRRLSPSRLTVVGGERAVCEATAGAAADAARSQRTRVAGVDRFETAALLAAGAPPGGEVVLASGSDFPDALAGGVRAGLAGGRVLLGERCALPAATTRALRALAPRRVTVVGGPAVVCDTVLSAVQAAVSGAEVRRLAGGDRFASAARIALDAFPTGADVVSVVNGHVFADALAAGPYSARVGAPLLLVEQCAIPLATREALLALRPTRVVVVGGEAAVCERVALELETFARTGAF